MPPEDYADRLVAYLREQRLRLGRGDGPRGRRRSCRRRSRRWASSPRSPASSSSGRTGPASSTAARCSPRRAEALAEVEPFDAPRRSRPALRGARGAARAVAAEGVPADPPRRHRARRSRRASSRASRCSAARSRSAPLSAVPRGSGLGGASGSSARWNASQARRRNWASAGEKPRLGLAVSPRRF